MIDERWVDAPKPVRSRKASQRDGVADAVLREARSANAKLNTSQLPRNRKEARRLLRGAGPYMRYRYEVDDEGVRRAVRVRG